MIIIILVAYCRIFYFQKPYVLLVDPEPIGAFVSRMILQLALQNTIDGEYFSG